MRLKNFNIQIYKIISKIYIYIFGRKNMQFINNLILSLSLNAKGYKNYGDLKFTGEENFIKLVSNDVKCCLDIGANIGNYTKVLLKKTKSNVFAFEPLSEAFEELKKIQKNFPERLKIENIALGDEDCLKKIYSIDEKSEKASLEKSIDKLSFIENKKIKEFNVQVKKLDSLNFFDKKNKIDFLKIDTEGYEFEVLKGAKKVLEFNKPNFIQIEFNWHQLFKKQSLYEISEFLSEYDVFQILPHGKKMIKINPNRPESNIYHLSNFVFIRKELSKKYQ
jgi:FkbM family methyltransferase